MIPQGRGFKANFAISACFAPVEVSEVGGVSLERGSVFVDQEAKDGDGLAVLDGDEEQPHKVHQRVRVRRAPERNVCPVYPPKYLGQYDLNNNRSRWPMRIFTGRPICSWTGLG